MQRVRAFVASECYPALRPQDAPKDRRTQGAIITDLAHRRLTPDFTFLYVSGGGMNCVSCGVCVYHLVFVC